MTFLGFCFGCGLLTGFSLCWIVGWMASNMLATFERINRHEDE